MLTSIFLILLTAHFLNSFPSTFQDEYMNITMTLHLKLFSHTCKRRADASYLEAAPGRRFMFAYENGDVIECADGVKRRVYPRFFTYAADYSEKCYFY